MEGHRALTTEATPDLPSQALWGAAWASAFYTSSPGVPQTLHALLGAGAPRMSSVGRSRIGLTWFPSTVLASAASSTEGSLGVGVGMKQQLGEGDLAMGEVGGCNKEATCRRDFF